MAEKTSLIRKRANIQASITNFGKKLDALEAASIEDRDMFRLQAALDGLRSRFQGFADLQDQLEELDESEMNKRFTIEDNFDDASGRALKLIAETSSARNTRRSPTPAIPTAAVSLKLPQIDVPKFDGLVENWNSFFDLFSCLIDKNDSLSPVQKLQYLRNAVTGRAAIAIDSLPTTDLNYDSALVILRKKFDCVQKTLRRHWALMCDYPRLQKDTPAALGDLVDTVQQHVRALQNLGQPTQSWDLPLIHLILSKISTDTAWHWELTLENSTLPTYTSLLEFLEKRASCIDNAPAQSVTILKTKDHRAQGGLRNVKGSNHPSRQAFVTVSASGCPICSETNHHIMKCPKFLAMTLTARQNAARVAALCYNCLKPNHQLSQCTSRNCSLCHKRHNTLLHKEESQDQMEKPSTSATQS